MEQSTIEKITEAGNAIDKVRAEIKNVLVGQAALVDQVLAVLLAGGHVLIEGVPGLGKTLLVKALAKAISADFSRIQFTPDLMPSDITGHAMYDMGKQSFEIRKGPIFTNLLLADEINRAPAKTQSALLEVMQEQQVTIEGESFSTGDPFMVFATQNPIEQDGTYPLPEAELDRFTMKILMDYPTKIEETELAGIFSAGKQRDAFSTDNIQAKISGQDLLVLQGLTREISLAQDVIDYAVAIVRCTREWPTIAIGAGPRATLALIACARSAALISGQAFVTPDHIKEVSMGVLRHRITLTAEMAIEGTSTDHVLGEILNHIEAPNHQ